MTMRLAISGSAGTGKSSLAMALANSLKIPYLEENFRRRRENGLVFQNLSRTDQSLLILELYTEAIEEAAQHTTGFVQDRCPIDFLAFWLHYGFWNEEKHRGGECLPCKTKQAFPNIREKLLYIKNNVPV